MKAAADELGWPLVLKPEAGQRGVGVRKISSLEQAAEVLRTTSNAMVVQAFHPGPYEAGIFYMKEPGATQGRIFSITDKIFPVITGDGQRTLAQLIRQHPRYRLQEAVFAARLADQWDCIPEVAERVPLAFAGNHCQGTLFQDGQHLWSSELAQVFDRIAEAIPDFHFGRFDIRYESAEALRQGTGFAIVELNGVMSESTNLYDPSWSCWRAYRTLFAQWYWLFRIGNAAAQQGAPVSRLADIWRDGRAYYSERDVSLVAD